MNILAQNIQKKYCVENTIEVNALKDINLNVITGETVAIIGPSGAGKSTLLHIMGLMDRPTSGKLFLNSEDTDNFNNGRDALERKNNIGFLFQLHYLLPDFTVLENIMLPIWQERHSDRKSAMVIIESLGLGERMNHMPFELSGGEQQRVALARALIKNPKLILADEPTGNLDRETGEKVEKLLFRECKERNITLVLVTHNSELAAMAGRTVKMRDGRII